MAYEAKINGNSVEIQKSDFISANNRLSLQYQQCQAPALRQEILKTIYDLDIRLFKDWKVFGAENRQDYRQEAYLWLMRALDTFNPEKGNFVSWLKFYYVKKAQTEVSENGQKAAVTTSEAIIEIQDEEDPLQIDALFWDTTKKRCTEEEWVIIEAKFLHGLTMAQAAEKAGIKQERAKRIYSQTIQRIKAFIATQNLRIPTNNNPLNQSKNPDEPQWVTKKFIQNRLGLTPSYLWDLLHPERPIHICPFYIDPADIIPIQGFKIRYLETKRNGLVHPAIIRKRR